MYYANESHLVTNNPRHHYIDSSCFMQMAHVLLNVGLLRKQWCALTVFRGRVKIAPKKKKKKYFIVPLWLVTGGVRIPLFLQLCNLRYLFLALEDV